jgi:UDP:flavonoid glycosyltransferase YjiC (YdhE family)
LAQGLRAQGAQVRFICRAHSRHQLDALGADAFAVTGLPAPPIDMDPVASTAADDYAR